ncbi:MAG: EVE domain-containing protein [Halocynthiibacter sp.]
MTAKYWIGVVHLGQARAVALAGFVAFSHGKRSAVEKVHAGDRVIFYAPKTDFDGEPVQAFVCLATVTGAAPRQLPMPGTDFRPWALDAAFERIREMPIRPMLHDLTFIKNPRYWGMAFRRSLFQISSVDFDHIASALMAKSEFGNDNV